MWFQPISASSSAWKTRFKWDHWISLFLSQSVPPLRGLTICVVALDVVNHLFPTLALCSWSCLMGQNCVSASGQNFDGWIRDPLKHPRHCGIKWYHSYLGWHLHPSFNRSHFASQMQWRAAQDCDGESASPILMLKHSWIPHGPAVHPTLTWRDKSRLWKLLLGKVVCLSIPLVWTLAALSVFLRLALGSAFLLISRCSS